MRVYWVLKREPATLAAGGVLGGHGLSIMAIGDTKTTNEVN